MPWLIAVGVLVRLPLLAAPLTYKSDVWRQADTASIARHFLQNGFHLLHPQIYWGGDGPGYVETEFQLYPFLVALLYRLFGEQLWLGRLVSLLFSIPASLLFHALARRLLGPRSALLALGFFLLSPLSLRYSMAFMPESTVLCFYLAALYLFHGWIEAPRLSGLLLCGACTAMAVLVKPTSIHIGLVFALLLIDRFGPRALLRVDLWLFALVCLVPGLLWYGHAQRLYIEYGNTFGILSGGDSKLGGMREWLSFAFYRDLGRLEAGWVFAGLGVPFFLLGLGLALRRGPRLIAYGAATVFVYYLIVARYARESWGLQYHVYALPYAALGVGRGLGWLLDRVGRSRQVPLVAAALLLLLAWTGPLYAEMVRPPPNLLIACARSVAQVVPRDARIIVSTVAPSRDEGVPNNYQEPTIFFYSGRYGWSLPADQHEVGPLVARARAGGRYFIVYSRALYESNPALVAYLRTHAEQVGPGIEKGCGIYQLSGPAGSSN